VITSDKCYENREWVYAYRENDAVGGYDPYSASKGCAELVVGAYRRSFFNPEKFGEHQVSVASSRAGNVIGGGDWAEDRIIPDCIRALEKKESILVRNPHAIRPWQHVLEPLSGYLRLAEAQWEHGREFADAFNFGPAATGNVTVREIVKRVIAAWGSGESHTPAGAEAGHATAHHEATFLKLDITKAATLLGWSPRYHVDEAVAQTVRWYKERAVRGKDFAARELCLAQISEFARRENPTPPSNKTTR
jgi:CDP-glucose 4,6-dehydratase